MILREGTAGTRNRNGILNVSKGDLAVTGRFSKEREGEGLGMGCQSRLG